MITISPDQNRASYDRIVQAVADALKTTPELLLREFRIMPSQVLMGVQLTPSQSMYSLNPRRGVDSPAVPGTSLLDQNDWFALMGVSLRIGRADFASNVASNHGTYPKLTFPDQNYFTGSGSAVGSEFKSLMNLVNGLFSLSVGGEQQIDPIPAQSLFYNPPATNTTSPAALPQWGGTPEEQGFFPVTPNFIIDAGADNSFKLELGNGARLNIDGAISTGTTDSTIRNFLYVVLNGWKIKNIGASSMAKSAQCAAV